MSFKVSRDDESNLVFTGKSTVLTFLKAEGIDDPVVRLKDGAETSTGKLVHLSFDKTRKIFTLMTYNTEDGSKDVTTIEFKTFVEPLPKLTANTFYQFTLGPGVYTHWKSSIHLNLCGQKSLALKGKVQKAVSDWNRTLPPDRQISISIISTPAPFSDLNQHCIYLIDDFMTEPNPKVAGSGFTYNTYDLSKLSIIDSDIFILKKEIEKSGHEFSSPELQQYIQYAVSHEMGHLLGLDHQFNPEIESIMSYKFDDVELAPYDKRAIRELYK